MTSLPRPPTAFIGRDAELAQLLLQLERGVRLVTLTGLGGVGKTRLALAAGAALAARGRAVAYCDAVGVHSVPELAMGVAAALELELVGLERAAPHAAVGLALAKARRGPLLLLVDNFEHLATVATDALVELLARAPELQLVVTSRVALMRPEELAVAVAPMRCDTPDAPAVELLLARAQAAPDSAWHVDRPMLQRLAARLDGLPLALELAAARAPLVTPEVLLALLDERLSLTRPGDPRRGSRDAAVAWSWDQLGADRRTALGRLAALGASFDLELAASIVGGTRASALEVLEVLARYSLLAAEHAPDGVRYRVLETVRDYALAQLDAAALDAAHAAIAEALLARVEPHLTAFSRELPPAAIMQVGRDRELYLAVIRRGLDAPGVPPLVHALRVGIALVPLFQRAGFGPVATAWTSRLLARPEIDRVPLPVRVGAAMVTVVAAATAADAGLVDELMARIAGWLGQAGASAFLVTSALGIVHYHRWDHPTLLALAESVLRSEPARASPELHAYARCAEVSSRRALGQADDGDDARLAAALDRLAAANTTTACLVVLTRAFLAIHRGAPERGLALCDDGLARTRGTLKTFDALFHLERGRALHALGRLAEAEAELDGALAMFDRRVSLRERQETQLDRALLRLELGRYADARADLLEAEPALGTSFERAWHAALAHALAALDGTLEPTGAAREPPPPPTGTVEDAACAALHALADLAYAHGPDVAAVRASAAAAGAYSFRARRALGLLDAAQALAAHTPGVAIALALDGSAFRVGPTWVDVSTRPLIRALLGVLAAARLVGGDGVARERLGAELWPDERLNAESRDQRLFTAVSTLRRLGLDDAVQAHDGAYRLDPARALLRVSPAVWPGAGEVQRARGRGRPRREKPT